MRTALVMLVVAVVGCSSGGDAAPPGSAARGAPAACAEDAAGCQAGCDAGRLEDCYELALRKIEARGTPLDEAGAEKLLARACAGKLVQSCGLAAWRVAERGEELADGRRAELDASCRAGDDWSCAALVSWAMRPAAPGQKERDNSGALERADLACKRGHLWSCAVLEFALSSTSKTDLDPGSAQKLNDRLAAIAEIRRTACAAGKRQGCRENSSEYMLLVRRDCAASDFLACDVLAVLSADPAEAMRAATAACEQGKVSCRLMCNGLRDGAAGEPDLAAARACYDKACASGEQSACAVRDDGPLLGGGCEFVDRAELPHIELKPLPRLVGEQRGGGRFDSSRDRKRRLYVFSASWDMSGPLSGLEKLAAMLAPANVEVVAVLSDAGWDRLHQLGRGRSFVAVLDPPDGRHGDLGAFTSGLGITKVPEALLVDESGAVRRHLVGPGVLLSPINARRCAEEILGRPR